MFHGASRKNWRSIEQGGFTPSREGGLGAGVYVTRSEQKVAWCSGKHFTNGVIIKLKVALGRYLEKNGQGHFTDDMMAHGYGSAFAPAGAIGVREENFIAGPSRIEIIGLQRRYKALCHYGRSCTRKKEKGCKFDHGRGDDKAPCERRKRRKRKSPSTKRLATKRQAMAPKQLEDGGVTGIKNGGAAVLRDGGAALSTNNKLRVLGHWI
jgi:hypothetical protein